MAEMKGFHLRPGISLATLGLSASQLFGGGLPGTVIGSSGSWNGNTISKAFDSNLSTYYDATNASGDWAGLDLGSGKIIKGIRYCPRPGLGYRMVGGQFQGANVANFSSGVVTLYTIMSAPPEGAFTAQALTNTTAFRYVRYIGPANGYCNVAEVEFYDATTPMPVELFSDFPVPWGYAIWGNAGTYNVNESYNNALRWAWPAGFLMSQRQSGVFRQTLYTEAAATAAGGAYDNLTQLNNTHLPNTLLLSTDPAHGQGFTWVSPNRDFSAFSAQGVKVNDVQVQIAPLGPRSASSSNHWAAVVFGAAPGLVVTNRGTGVLIRNGGGYKVFDGGNSVISGNAGSNQFYKVEFQINSINGAYTLLIKANTIYSGTHAGGYSTSNYITLEGYNIASDTGIQNDYFQSLQVWGNQPAAAANTRYYLSPTGNDTNSGASSSAPWQTLARANVEQFQAGDKILLQGGQTFNGCLQVDSGDSGTPGSPLTVSSYGTGNATINGRSISAVSVYDAHDVAISNLTLVGNGYASNQGDGIGFINDRRSALANFTITGVDASNVGNKGISFVGTANNILVTQSSLHDNGEGGIWVQGANDNNPTYGTNSSRCVIDHVNASHNPGTPGDGWSGYGISIVGVSGAVIQYCVAGNNGWLPGQGGGMSGIQVTYGDHVLIQHCERHHTFQGSWDGEGITFEQVKDAIMQFNYTHDTDGGGLGEYNLDLQAKNAGNNLMFEVGDADPGYNNSPNLTGPQIMGAGLTQVVLVYDPTVPFTALYTNGVLVASGAINVPISALKDVRNYIGTSTYTGDPTLTGRLTEFRVYSGALSAAQVAANYQAGPNAFPNVPPVLPLIGNQTIYAGQTLSIANEAADLSVLPQTSSYSLPVAPVGAVINTTNGLLTWRPTIAQSPSTNSFSVVMSDNGVPSLSATQSFAVTVLVPATPVLGSLVLSNGLFSLGVSGSSGPDYILLGATNLVPPVTWQPMQTNPAAVTPFSFTIPAINSTNGFFRIRPAP